MQPRDTTYTEPAPKDSRRALISSFLGSTVEYYDFLLYGAAAGLVFPKLFFPDTMDPVLGSTLSFVILLAGYISRPVGGVLFGHFGDKFGRKNILVITLLMMGLVSVAIGLMPTYASIGVAAPLILVALRVVQGLAVGGGAGATLMAAEHRGRGQARLRGVDCGRGRPHRFRPRDAGARSLLGSARRRFLQLGWRVPFLLSATLVIVALVIALPRNRVPDFAKARAAGEVHTGQPILRVLMKYPHPPCTASSRRPDRCSCRRCWRCGWCRTSPRRATMPRQDALYMLTFSSFVHIFAIPFFAWLSDRHGRRKVMLAGAAVSTCLVFPMFAMFNSGATGSSRSASLWGNPIIQASMYGPIGAFLAEKFDTAGPLHTASRSPSRWARSSAPAPPR